jgi:hypothetical protein
MLISQDPTSSNQIARRTFMDKRLCVPMILAAAGSALADEPRPHQLTAVPIRQVSIDDGFWSAKR